MTRYNAAAMALRPIVTASEPILRERTKRVSTFDGSLHRLLADMLETRHTMSQAVRSEVSDKSHQWGYRLGSIYIRKVHFRDRDMIRQIEEKVVNRLRQVTSAIRQDGANQVSIITNTAERMAAKMLSEAIAA